MPHLNTLASRGFTMMMVNPFELRDALDASTDLRHDLGETMEEDFPVLLIEREAAQTPYFKHCLHSDGIRWPVVVIIMPDGSWQVDDGHNRLRFGLLNNVDVPVIFDDSGDGEDSILREEVKYLMDMAGEPVHSDEGPAGWDETIKINPILVRNLVPFPRSGELPKINVKVG